MNTDNLTKYVTNVLSFLDILMQKCLVQSCLVYVYVSISCRSRSIMYVLWANYQHLFNYQYNMLCQNYGRSALTNKYRSKTSKLHVSVLYIHLLQYISLENIYPFQLSVCWITNNRYPCRPRKNTYGPFILYFKAYFSLSTGRVGTFVETLDFLQA